MRRSATLWTVLLALASTPVFAQRFSAAIRGSVVDPTQATVEGAKVTLRSEDTGLTRTATTNSAGLYSFKDCLLALPGRRRARRLQDRGAEEVS